jgi:hypothetical protein
VKTLLICRHDEPLNRVGVRLRQLVLWNLKKVREGGQWRRLRRATARCVPLVVGLQPGVGQIGPRLL